ncbi:O-phospho-L-seryl-tRNA:Cys-tRNA synthase [archaeon CG_4_10_14_0_2_um_filter_Archaea_38_6]|nr:MAG: O-phospho-L-seryl-tRNA:Cys-tRNA synthase [archaeon CG_4_10_14_0_2_um_filter_Archaea_38_6]
MTELRVVEEDFINLNPLQTGGRTTPDVRKAVNSFIDGYSVCDWCLGDVNTIKNPDIQGLRDDIGKFLGADEVILTNGCREAKYAVMQAVCKKGGKVLADVNRHYSTDVAAELAGLKMEFVQNSGSPEFKIRAEDYAKRIDEVSPDLVLLTHVDGNYGNVADAAKVGAICRKKGVPFILNAAYSAGRMLVDNKKIRADFIACSGHKSWAVGGGNIGLLGVNNDFKDKVLKRSSEYKNKILGILGCSARGSSAVALLNSFPSVKKRVKDWGKEVKNAQWFANKMLSINGVELIGENPHQHDLMQFSTPVFYEISQKHKKKGYFLYKFLEEKGVRGLKAGRTKNFKVSTYGLGMENLKYVFEVFREAAKL